MKKIFEQEKALAGILDNKVGFASKVAKSEKPYDFSAFRATASMSDDDLYPVRTVLVTSSINLNDDYFGKKKLAQKCHTASDKPCNLEHETANIIGHSIFSNLADDEYNYIDPSDEECIEKCSEVHIITNSVLYRFNWDAELSAKMNAMFSEIEAGEWYVSMECLFNDFNYLLKDSDGNASLIERNEATSFLTKHLRAYGGKGQYENWKVYRALEDFRFVGKGFTKNPANPKSYVLDQNNKPISKVKVYTSLAEFTEASVVEEQNLKNIADIVAKANEPVYLNPEGPLTEKTLEIEMTLEEKQKLETEIAELSEKLKATETKNAELTAEVAKLNEQVTEALKAGVSDLEKAEEVAKKLTEDLKVASEAKATAESKIAEIEEAKKADKRIAMIKDAYKIDEAKASEMNVAMKALSDEAFESILKQTQVKAEVVVTPTETEVVEAAVVEGDASKPKTEEVVVASTTDTLKNSIAKFMGKTPIVKK